MSAAPGPLPAFLEPAPENGVRLATDCNTKETSAFVSPATGQDLPGAPLRQSLRGLAKREGEGSEGWYFPRDRRLALFLPGLVLDDGDRNLHLLPAQLQ